MPANRKCSPAIAAIQDDLLAEHLGTTLETVARTLASTGSLIKTVSRLRGAGRTLRRFEAPDLNAAEATLADGEALDPEKDRGFFEPFAKRGLLRRRKGLPLPD